MTTPKTPAWPGSSYGIGLEIADHAGTIVWSHSGGVAGYAAWMMMVPSDGFALVLLLDSDGGWVDLDAQAYKAFTGKTLAQTKRDAPQPADADAAVGDY